MISGNTNAYGNPAMRGEMSRCILYPGSGSYENGNTDLPQRVFVHYGQTVITLSRFSDENRFAGYKPDLGSIEIRQEMLRIIINGESMLRAGWALYENGEYSEDEELNQSTLIDHWSGDGSEGGIISDDFPEQCTIYYNGQAICVQRDSLCVWSEVDGDAMLRYNAAKEKWELRVDGGPWMEREDDQERPDGGNTYQAPWVGGPTATVLSGCTETTCCMYPASGLVADDYSWSDVLNTILVPDIEQKPSYDPLGDGGAGDSSGVYTKSGESLLRDDGNWKIVIDADRWQFQAYYADEWHSVQVEALDNCLITGDGNLEPGNDTVEDQFAGTLYVTGSTAEHTFTDLPLVRRSLCVWSSVPLDSGDDGLLVAYDPGTKLINMQDFYSYDPEAGYLTDNYAKDGDSNTPTGDYWESSLTVSE